MVTGLQLPKMKINGFRKVLSLPTIDTFSGRTFNNQRLNLTVHQDEVDNKYYAIHSVFQVYGWTADVNDAFQAWNNIGIYTNQELYDGLRGRKI